MADENPQFAPRNYIGFWGSGFKKADEIPSPPSQPEGSPVGAGTEIGAASAQRRPDAKLPNTVRKSRAVNNAGERRGGKS